MKYIKIISLLLLILAPVFGESIMKVTLSGDLSEVNLASLSKIVFSNDTMTSLESLPVEGIDKIERYNENLSETGNLSEAGKDTQSDRHIGISFDGSNVIVNMEKHSRVDVQIVDKQGAVITKLFSGNTYSNQLSFSLEGYNLGFGVYAVVVERENELFIAKITIAE
ncbi:MAG: hypothetical protein HQK83_09285 [Fibrobacteria bacterium]|nr:hypothetical protein [Fibrobacteria bacterium]